MLKSFHVRHELLQIFYSSSLYSVLTFGLSSWGGNTSKHDRRILNKITRKPSAVLGRTQDALHALYDRLVTNKLMDILDDPTRPLRHEFDERLIQRSGRMRVPRARTTRYLNSFVPQAVFLSPYEVDVGRYYHYIIIRRVLLLYVLFVCFFVVAMF